MHPDPARLVESIAAVGKDHPSWPNLAEVEALRGFLEGGELHRTRLDQRDGPCTRRELVARFLLLSAVADQGPDLVGVRQMAAQVTNALYRAGVRFLHTPESFFSSLGMAVDEIDAAHTSVAEMRSAIWAKANQSTPARYNLFMDNSRQVLSYAVFRWGVPLALPLLLEKQARGEEERAEALLRYLQRWKSAEEMSRELKSNHKYGLGKAIGDKACHLFAKWIVASYRLVERSDPSWGPFSFEVPYDSNAGRVLWRTGYLLTFAAMKEYEERDVVQRGGGKGGTHYIRVTNIRGMPATKGISPRMREAYSEICVRYLRTHKLAPKKVEIQRVQHIFLNERYKETGLDVAAFDEGLIHIGTNYYSVSPKRMDKGS